MGIEEIPSGRFCVSRNYEARSLVSPGKECGSEGERELGPSAALSAPSQTQTVSNVTLNSAVRRCSRAAVLKALGLDQQQWQRP